MDSSVEKKGLERKPLYMVTPTIQSGPMTKIAGFKVFLKLENLQQPGSFKIRGLSNLCVKAADEGCLRIICPSGGSAGMAAAYAARNLGLKCTIVIPETTPSSVGDQMRNEGADVIVQGSVWDESNEYAKQLAKSHDGYTYVHPFDDPDIWEGHASMILEAAEQLPCRPDVVVASVGGGGLMNGILHGMWKVGWNDVPFVAMETEGANCFNASLNAGKKITLPAITSVAKCLGALTCSSTSLEYTSKHKIISQLVTDKQAVHACLEFADDHRMLVQPACGASLSTVYSGVINQLQAEEKLPKVSSALIIVCGGSIASLGLLNKLKEQFSL
ncbi:hypothetical protein ScPMuIL_006015 [Solemya velum]